MKVRANGMWVNRKGIRNGGNRGSCRWRETWKPFDGERRGSCLRERRVEAVRGRETWKPFEGEKGENRRGRISGRIWRVSHGGSQKQW